MKILLNRIWINPESFTAQQKGSVSGEVVFDKGLKIEFQEDLLPEELDYIRDGLADLTQRVRERIIRAIQANSE